MVLCCHLLGQDGSLVIRLDKARNPTCVQVVMERLVVTIKLA